VDPNERPARFYYRKKHMPHRRALLLIACMLPPAPALAQTSDVFFGGWSWRSREPGSRPAGLAGSFVAVADGVRATPINPAGLALIPKVEGALGTGPFWIGVARRSQQRAAEPPSRPTEASFVPCPPPRRARPLALALYAEQPETMRNALEVVRGPGTGETAALEATTEELGAGLAKGLFPWLDVGVTIAWRHLRMDGAAVVTDALEHEQQRVTLAGDSNKARAIVGGLASFGPSWSPTAFRVGVSYQWDLMRWSVERTVIDRARGVAGEPAPVTITEPPVLSAGVAWRLNDTWLVTGQLDYTWYDRIARATAESAGPGHPFVAEDHFEPRGAIEMTRPSPVGGYYKVRAGVRREISGRVAYLGDDSVLRQAFRDSPEAFRGSVGFSLLGEFYEKAFRLDLDLSQVVLQRSSTLSATGTRQLSFGLTARL
jgi:hypothetical protein